MADELVARFHEIKHQVKELHFRNELEQAFIARGVVERLNSADVRSGALVKYHNPSKHSAPGMERSINGRFGERGDIERQDQQFYESFPEFAPRVLSLLDERQSLTDDNVPKDGGDREQAA